MLSLQLKSTKTRSIIIVSLLAGIVIVIGLILVGLNKPSVGKLTTKTSLQSSPRQPSWTKLRGKQFSLDYLSDYVSKQADLHQDRDEYFFIEDGLITKHLAVAVTDMKDHGLADEPAYRMRSLAPETYRLDTRLLNGVQIPVMERLDHTEQVAFVVRGKLLGTIALTTGDPANPPREELNHMITSWVWK